MENFDNSLYLLLLGQRMKTLIYEAGYTLGTFAIEFGKSTRQLSRWVNEGITDLEDIMEICQFLGKSFTEQIKIVEEEMKNG